MPEYVSDEAFEHRLERVLREIGNEAVLPFDPYETTQIAISRSKIGMVPITQIPMDQLRAQQMSQQNATPFTPSDAPPIAPPLVPPLVPPPGPPPGYYDEPLPDKTSRMPLLAALGLLIAALVFAGFASGFIKLPTNFGFTIGSPAPTQTASPVVTLSPSSDPTPDKTRKPRRTPRPRRTQAPIVTAEPQPTLAPTDLPTQEPVPTTLAQPTPESVPTQDAPASPI